MEALKPRCSAFRPHPHRSDRVRRLARLLVLGRDDSTDPCGGSSRRARPARRRTRRLVGAVDRRVPGCREAPRRARARRAQHRRASRPRTRSRRPAPRARARTRRRRGSVVACSLLGRERLMGRQPQYFDEPKRSDGAAVREDRGAARVSPSSPGSPAVSGLPPAGRTRVADDVDLPAGETVGEAGVLPSLPSRAQRSSGRRPWPRGPRRRGRPRARAPRSAFTTKRAGSGFHGMMSIFSPRSSERPSAREPRGPTHADRVDALGVRLDRDLGAVAGLAGDARISTRPSAISTPRARTAS